MLIWKIIWKIITSLKSKFCVILKFWTTSNQIFTNLNLDKCTRKMNNNFNDFDYDAVEIENESTYDLWDVTHDSDEELEELIPVEIVSDLDNDNEVDLFDLKLHFKNKKCS